MADAYTETNDSSTCSHPSMSQHPHTDATGNVSIRAHCPSCGMEWQS